MAPPVMHRTPFSGSWYPAEANELQRLLGRLWEESEQRTGRFLLPEGRAFVVPHAGLVYSGRVAASVYRHIQRQKPRRVVLAGFAHRGAPPGIFLPEIEGYKTPLGSAPLDLDFANQLGRQRPFEKGPESVLCDHSIEIQLPLLQWALPEAAVVPMYVGRLDEESREAAAEALASTMTPDTVLIASSDLTHYGREFGFQPFPADWTVAERLRELDFKVVDAASSLSAEHFLQTLRETSATVCGYNPVALLLAAVGKMGAGGEVFQEVLDYQTSGEITGDYRHSVSYGALGYFPHPSFELSPEDGAALLKLARQTLDRFQRTGRREAPEAEQRKSPGLERRAPLFVTLHREGQLRGCLGNMAPDDPLAAAVPELTLAAALEDTRFQPVSSEESGIEIEISILTPLKRLLRLSDFRVGEHGALLRLGGRQGLLLPQVATERGWSAEKFLRALGVKAGAGERAFEDPAAEIRVFRAQVIR